MFKTLNRILPTALLLTVAIVSGAAQAQPRDRVASSLLLLIDASGSMGDPVGGGHPQAKIDAAKQAATAALGRAARGGAVEVAVLAFSGDCANPVPSHQPFTCDVDRLTAFINGLQPGGGTPMADALLFASRFMDQNGHPGAADRMIMLLADGQNDCGDVSQSMAALQAGGIVFRHETVGFGITPNSQAAQDLRDIATQTGGTYHHAADAAQLADVFMEFVNTFTVIDLLGQFGKGASSPASSPPPNPSGQSRADGGRLSGLLGGFKAPPNGNQSQAPASYHGALAIDSNQGQSWGWAIDYPTPSAAAEQALAKCGSGCSIVMRFSDECAAYAADQTEGSTVYGWASGYESGGGAQARAMAECGEKGGTSCIVRAWGCTRL